MATPTTPSTSSDYLRVCGIAEGGMGTVDVALRMEGRFRRLYAIKRLRPHLSAEPEIVKMFLDEARIAGLLRHPNVVSVLDVGEDERGSFLVMDFVEGITLGALIRAAGQLPLQIAVRVALDTARGLHAAHQLVDHDGTELHLVHRDMSPSNVLLSYDGDVRISDFGIAKALGRSTRTSTGVLKGKMAYMSPEQLRFEDADRRSDLFALGVVLYEMLSGARLYADSDGNEGVRRILNEPPPDIGEVRPTAPPALVEISLELLSKDREERPQTAAEVAERLERILSEMLLSEPRIDLGAFLRETFGDALTAQRKQLAEAVDAAEAGKGTVELAAPITVDVLPTKQLSPRRGRRTSALVGVVALVLSIGLLGGWLIGRMGDPAAPATEGTLTDEVVPPAEVPFVEPSSEEATEAPTPTEPVVAPAAMTQPPVEDEPLRERARARKNRPARMVTMERRDMRPDDGLPIVGWEQ